MKKVFIVSLAVIFGFALVMGCAPEEKAKTEETAAETPAKTTFVTIGTGGITGVYYPTGGAIARIVNRKKDEYGIRATVESTGGSVFNVNAVMAGDLEFGVVQSDRQFQAINGMAEWEDKGKQEDLRAVFTIHPESITLVAAVDANIETIQDLKGKRVNIGNPGSGQRQNSIDALTAVGIDYESDLTAESVKAAEAPGLLQDGRIDAFFYTVGPARASINSLLKILTMPRQRFRFLFIREPRMTPTSIPLVSRRLLSPLPRCRRMSYMPSPKKSLIISKISKSSIRLMSF